MKQRTQNFALGLAFIAFLVLFLATFIFLYPALRAGGRTVEIHFRHEDGLAPLKAGSAVLLADSLDVGRVRDIRIRQVADPHVKGAPRTVFAVRTQIRADVPLYGNCEITTNQPAIGGPGYVSILNVGTPDVPLVQPVQGLAPQSFSAAIGTLSRRLLSEGGLVDRLSEMVDPNAENALLHKIIVSLDDVNALTRELRTQMSPHAQASLLFKIHRVLDDLNATTAALRAELAKGADSDALLAKVHLALAHLDEGLSEAAAMLRENRALVHDTLTSAEHAARSVDQDLLVALRAELDPASPTSTLGKLHVVMDRTSAILADVQGMTSEGERMVVLSRPALEQILANFLEMSQQLRLTSQEILLNPSKLILPPKREREEKLVVFRAASGFAEAAEQLDQAAGRLEAVLKTLPADDRATPADRAELQSIFDAVRSAFQRFTRAEETLWEQLK